MFVASVGFSLACHQSPRDYRTVEKKKKNAKNFGPELGVGELNHNVPFIQDKSCTSLSAALRHTTLAETMNKRRRRTKLPDGPRHTV